MSHVDTHVHLRHDVDNELEDDARDDNFHSAHSAFFSICSGSLPEYAGRDLLRRCRPGWVFCLLPNDYTIIATPRFKIDHQARSRGGRASRRRGQLTEWWLFKWKKQNKQRAVSPWTRFSVVPKSKQYLWGANHKTVRKEVDLGWSKVSIILPAK